MKRSHIIAGVLMAIAAAGAAQIPRLTLPPKKGAILDVRIEPASPTRWTPVTLRISVADNLRLDRAQMRKTANMFTVNVYWIDPADGDSSTAGSQPVHHDEPLGTLSPGRYLVSIQSFYRGRLADVDYVSFRVSEAPPPWASENIDNVWIEPEDPTTSDTVTLNVSGKWPASGFSLHRMIMVAIQREVTLQMYWSSPTGAVLPVVTPYESATILRHLIEGTYTVRVECNLDDQLVDWADMSFEVKPADGGSPPDGDGWPWDGWPWDFPD